MALAYAALLALVPLAPVMLIGEIIPQGAEDVIIEALAYILLPFVMIFG